MRLSALACLFSSSCLVFGSFLDFKNETSSDLMAEVAQEIQTLDEDAFVAYLLQRLENGHRGHCHIGISMTIAKGMFTDTEEPQQHLERVIEALANGGLDFGGYEDDVDLHYVVWGSAIGSRKANLVRTLIRQGLAVVGKGFNALEVIQSIHRLQAEYVQELMEIPEIKALDTQARSSI